MLNEYQTFIEETRAKIKGRDAKDLSQNMYRLDGKVREMVEMWDQWRRNDALTSEEIRAKLKQIQVELETEIASFRAEWERRMEKERREREEEERRRREERERREAEERQREREKRIENMLQVRDQCRQLFDVSCWFSDSELNKLYLSLQGMWDPLFFESWLGSMIPSRPKSSSSRPTSAPCSTPCTSVSTVPSRQSLHTPGMQSHAYPYGDAYSRGDAGYQWGAGISSLFRGKAKSKAKAKRTQPQPQPQPQSGGLALHEMHESQESAAYPLGAYDGPEPYLNRDWGYTMSPYYEQGWGRPGAAGGLDMYTLLTNKESLTPSYSLRGAGSQYSYMSGMADYPSHFPLRRSTSVSTVLSVGGHGYDYADRNDPYGSRGDVGAYESVATAQEILSSLWFMTPLDSSSRRAPSLEKERCESTIRLSCAASYTGEVLLGVPDGQGKLVDVTTGKLVYAGAWREGKFHGRGTLYSGEFELESGEFEAGRFVSGRKVNADGSMEIGTFVNGVLECEGRIVYPSLAVVSGVWREGKPAGRMRYALPGWEEFEYDEAEADANVKRQVVLNANYIYFRSTEVDGAIPDFLFYSNGDIFVGETQMRTRPYKGLFFHMIKRGYCRMEMNGGYPGMKIHDITVLVNENNKLKKVLFC